MTRDDLIYMAALIDGEGSAGFFSHGTGQPTQFVIEIKMTDHGVIQWCKDTFGGMKCQLKVAKSHYKPMWRWRVTAKTAREIYKQVEPFMKIKGGRL